MNKATETRLREMLKSGETISTMMEALDLTRADIMKFSAQEDMRRAEEMTRRRRQREAERTGKAYRPVYTDYGGGQSGTGDSFGGGLSIFTRRGPGPRPTPAPQPAPKSDLSSPTFADTVNALVRGK